MTYEYKKKSVILIPHLNKHYSKNDPKTFLESLDIKTSIIGRFTVDFFHVLLQRSLQEFYGEFSRTF